jgi:hypothetical protein
LKVKAHLKKALNEIEMNEKEYKDALSKEDYKEVMDYEIYKCFSSLLRVYFSRTNTNTISKLLSVVVSED